MTVWDEYPSDYRRREVEFLLSAARAGDCASVVGLSGAGKSNLLGFLAARAAGGLPVALVDCNRLSEPSRSAFFSLVRHAILRNSPGGADTVADEYSALEAALAPRLESPSARFCLILDRFDALEPALLASLAGSLRALRDAFKYQLSTITASRRPLDPRSELAELFYAHTLWLGPLVEGDARWSISHYAAHRGLNWEEAISDSIIDLSWGYPSFLRAVCEAHVAGCPLELETLRSHPAVQQRIDEFWSDAPGAEELRLSGLEGHPLLRRLSAPASENSELTAKEALLLAYLREHPGEVCDKDDLIRAAYPEDKAFLEGIRDDSLAQLIRRLRRKIEPDPTTPRYIHSVIGRGYKYTP